MAKHPSVGLHGTHRPFDTCHRGLTSPNITGATLRGGVLPDSDNHVRAPMLLSSLWMPDSVSPEAVTQESSAAGPLLPYRHSDVVGRKLIAGFAKVHRLAHRIGAESVVRQLNPSKRNLGQQCFNSVELHW
jgi:hypothetical protein